jgi:hypothetical protein
MGYLASPFLRRHAEEPISPTAWLAANVPLAWHAPIRFTIRAPKAASIPPGGPCHLFAMGFLLDLPSACPWRCWEVGRAGHAGPSPSGSPYQQYVTEPRSNITYCSAAPARPPQQPPIPPRPPARPLSARPPRPARPARPPAPPARAAVASLRRARTPARLPRGRSPVPPPPARPARSLPRPRPRPGPAAGAWPRPSAPGAKAVAARPPTFRSRSRRPSPAAPPQLHHPTHHVPTRSPTTFMSNT